MPRLDFLHIFAIFFCLSFPRPATIPFEIQLSPRSFLKRKQELRRATLI